MATEAAAPDGGAPLAPVEDAPSAEKVSVCIFLVFDSLNWKFSHKHVLLDAISAAGGSSDQE